VPLTHHGFPIDRGNPVTGPWLNKVPHLEINRFHVSPGLTARQLFEHAYFIFGRFVVFPFSTYLPTGIIILGFKVHSR
jgi:hypothetical protein